MRGLVTSHDAYPTRAFCFLICNITLSLLRGAARLSFTARIEGAHSDRAASASKKDGLAVPLPPFQARSLSLQGWGLIDLLLRATSHFPISFSRVAWSILDCARRTSTFLSCAFREQEDGQAT